MSDVIVRCGAACLATLFCFPALAQSTDGRTSEEMTARVDELLDEAMRDRGWEPAGACDDSEFLRRVYLDLTGRPPTGRRALDFLEQTSEAKDAELVEELLVSREGAQHLASIWSGWLLPEDNAANPFAQQNGGLSTWLEQRFSRNLRYDRLVADLMVATGTPDGGPAGFFVALGGEPKRIAAKTARVFMGVQLDCAECHDHPFDRWSQRDFWGYAAYFAQISPGDAESGMRVQSIGDTGEGEVMLPDTDEIVPPKPLVETGLAGSQFGTRRQQLTLWLTARENPFLARATVNRVWAILFGRGLVEPIDDMRSIDMASHPELLSELSDYFAETNYDLRNLFRTLANTRAYRRSSLHAAGEPPEDSFAVMVNKPLTEQQLAASIAHTAGQVTGDQSDAFRRSIENQLGKLRGDASAAKLGIVSALVTLHGDSVDAVSREQTSRLIKALEAPFMDDSKRIRWLFLATLCRPPTDQEHDAVLRIARRERAAAQQGDGSDSDAAASKGQVQWQSDLLWALLNSTEFAMTP
jgi:hypothetical protein